MIWYKEASPSIRNKNMRLFLKYKKLGLIPEPKVCYVCKKTKNEVKCMDWHNEEYNISTELLVSVNKGTKNFDEIKDELMSYVKPMCRSCHLKLHKEWKKSVDYSNNPKYQ